jgi:hypothetical protein
VTGRGSGLRHSTPALTAMGLSISWRLRVPYARTTAKASLPPAGGGSDSTAPLCRTPPTIRKTISHAPVRPVRVKENHHD